MVHLFRNLQDHFAIWRKEVMFSMKQNHVNYTGKVKYSVSFLSILYTSIIAIVAYS